MGKTNKLLIILFALMFLTLVNAQVETLGNFKINSCIELKQTCSNCTFNNVSSVLYPNSTSAITNMNMTKSGTSYSLIFCNTSVLGSYIVNGYGDIDGVITVWAYDFKVTQTGNTLTTAEGILYIIFLAILILAFVISTFFAIQIDFKNKRSSEGKIVSINDFKYMKIFFIVVSYLLLVFIFGITRSIMANFLFIDQSGVFTWLYFLLFSMMYPIIIIALIFGVVNYLEDKKLIKLIERGLNPR